MDKEISLYQQIATQFQPLGQIQALLLTTFCLDVGYLEKSILPAFFPNLGEGPASEPHRPLFEYLEEIPTPISIMYDANNLLRGETKLAATGSVIKELRWQAHPVMRTVGCFHPKAIVALTRKEHHQFLVIGCSSANLTRPGWGQNFEACAIEVMELRPGMQSSLAVDVRQMLQKLQRDAPGSTAIDQMLGCLDAISPYSHTQRRYQQSYRSRLWFGQDDRNLGDWLRKEVMHGDLKQDNVDWHLEVLSPYFSTQPPHLIEWASECFSKRGVETDTPPILYYCPKDGELVDVDPEAAGAFAAVEHAAWAEFPSDRLRSQLRDQEGNRLQRFLHAKVYRFWHPDCELLVVGSANASTQGHQDNLPGNDEACLVFSREVEQGAKQFTPWLRPLQRPLEVSQCKPRIDAENNPTVDPVPYLSVEFDWQSRQLTVNNYDARSLALYVGALQRPTMTLEPDEENCQILDARGTQALFISPTVKVTLAGSSDKAWLCLVEERNLHLKPPAPTMERGIDDLIRDWQLGVEQRQADHIARAAMPDDMRASSMGASPELDEGVGQDRLNDLFMAMYRFRTDMSTKLGNANGLDAFARMQLQARLFGRGAMSVRYMISKLCPTDDPQSSDKPMLDVLEQYLGIMSLRDAVRRLQVPVQEAGMEDEMRELLAELDKHYRVAKKRLLPQLKQDAGVPDAKKLLAWVESKFSYDLQMGPGAAS